MITVTAVPDTRRHPTGLSRLDTAVSSIMRPGVVSVAEDASLQQARRAMIDHGTHAILVVGSRTGVPLGWITSRGLLSRLECDPFMPCSQSITEPPTYIGPSCSAAEAAEALSQPGVTHLLVSRMPGYPPEGIVSDFDLVRLVV
jgi:CBS domain-containing protein